MPTYRMIYLGNFADIDPNESSTNAEAATGIFAGRSIGGSTDPLHGRVLDVTMNDSNGDGQIYHDNYSGSQERISYQLGDPPVSYSREIDGAFLASGTQVVRLLPDGRTDTVTTTIRVFQDTAGNTFMIPPPVTGGEPGEVQAVTTYPIVGIRLPAARNFTTQLGIASADRYNLQGFVPCFAAGTLIRTPDGEARVEDLAVGDPVWTRDHGIQPIRWRGLRRLDAAELAANPRLRPVRIRAGALGPNRPAQDLTVSPQHRVLIRSQIAQRMFSAPELLVAACQLTEVPGIEIVADAPGVTYVHLLFDRHEVLMSNGAETESLFPGPQALLALGPAAEEILTLFPELRDDATGFPAARPFASGRRARQLAGRHAAKSRALTC
ncbi:Hint domain-containing protein [Paracoccus spongiarum]|uniref:Hint domain-containing protein n=1 Tax=Paracoccus spongiarum TaxID=3064387 RepID=A0ABT9JED8_9RHOB|nr:Hint domain-containing protein [Paracoccus sp. 2205BS29-5]MDP5308200.1 Hint domain-containing protein [Paracoccus sp. 2205BS29-5]